MCHNLLNHHFRSSNNPIIGQLFHLIMLHKQQQGEQQGPQWPSSHQAMIIMKNITWSSVLYTTARWSAAPPVATKLSSSPTPSSITFLYIVIDLILLVVFMMVAMMITKIMSGNDWSPFCTWKINFCKVWSISADCFVWSFLRKIVFVHAPVFLDVGQQGDRPAATKTENCDHHILLVFPFWRLCVNIAKFDIFLPLEPFFCFTILATPPTDSVENKDTIWDDMD